MARVNVVKRNEDALLREQILGRCRRLLMRGHFRPGQKLPLRPMAEEFKTSLMPVRDALNTLVADGALEMTKGRTVRVPEFSDAQFVEFHEIRCSLEGLAASFAVMNLSPSAVGRIEELIVEMAEAFSAGAYEQYIEAHFSFHFTIYNAAKRPTLLSLIETLWLQLGPSFRQGIETARVAYEMQHEQGDPNHIHRRIVDGIRAKDAKAVREAVELDIRTGMQVYQSGTWPTDLTID